MAYNLLLYTATLTLPYIPRGWECFAESTPNISGNIQVVFFFIYNTTFLIQLGKPQAYILASFSYDKAQPSSDR